MRRLTDRQVRYLCWKIKRGSRLPDHLLTALLGALVARKPRLTPSVTSANDNAFSAQSRAGCVARRYLLQRYEDSVLCWLQKVLALGHVTDKQSHEYCGLWRLSAEARRQVAKVKKDYERHIAAHGCGGACGFGP